MKRLFFVFALIVGMNSFVFSQNWFIGAGANFGFSKDSIENDSGENELNRERLALGISPEIGYKINKFDFGIRPIIQYRYTDTKQEPMTDSINIFSFGAGIFSRYNFITLFDRLSILGRMDLSYLYTKDKYKNSNGKNSYSNENITHEIGLSVSPIIEFKVSDRITLYSSMQTTYTKNL